MTLRSRPIPPGSLRLHGEMLPVQPPATAIAPDCRHYRGDKPCLHNRLCKDCPHYAPYQSRLCIIKLGALGDVIRTLAILPELRRQNPQAHITWVSKPNGCTMLAGHPLIDRLLPFDSLTAMILAQEAFDLVLSLDKEPAPCALAMTLFAKRKLGVGLSPQGTPVPLNREAQEYFQLGLCDELKFRVNRKSYPQLVHEALGLPWRNQRYTLPLHDALRDRVRLMLANRGWQPGQPTVGINVGAGHAFANKMWPAPRIVEVIRGLRQTEKPPQILLLGGPNERVLVDRILDQLHLDGGATGVIDPGCEHAEPVFVALVDAVDVLLTGDTMAMHVAIARAKGVVALFGPTCAQEIELYGLGEKLVAQTPCAPCYKRHCDKGDICVQAIPTEQAVAAVIRVLQQQRERQAIVETPPAQRLAG